MTNLLDPAWTEFQMHVRGNVHEAEYAGFGIDVNLARDISQFVTQFQLIDSLNEAGVRAEIEVDLTDNNITIPIGVGTDFFAYTKQVDPLVGGIPSLSLQHSGRCFTTSVDTTTSRVTGHYTAHDVTTYLARDEGNEVFTDETLSALVYSVSAITGHIFGTITPTTVSLGQIVQSSSMTWWAVLQEGISRHYRKTGERFFIRGNANNTLDLMQLGGTGRTFHLLMGPNGELSTHSASQTFEEGRTVVRVVTEETDEGGASRLNIVSEQSLPADDPLVRYFGTLRKVVPPDNSTKDAESNSELTAAELRTSGELRNKLSTSSLLLPGIRRGDQVRVEGEGTIPMIWYVETVTTTYTPGDIRQAMDLVATPGDVAA